MKKRSVLPMKVAKYGYIVISVLFCVAGLGIVLWPISSAGIVGILFGIAMLVFGLIKLIGYYSKDLFRLAFEYDLQLGGLLCILGILTLLRKTDVTGFVCIAFGVSVIADSLFKIRIARDAKSFGIRLWWLTVIFAVSNTIAGILMMLCPLISVTEGQMLGVSLITEGILSLSVAVTMIKIIDHQQPDMIPKDCDMWEEK